jgi:two-component system cell cycle response regulator DivK
MEGHTIVEASSGEDGLKVAPSFRPDLVILDISLAGDIDGVETLKRLRADDAFQKTPVVALTAHAMKNDREAILAAGFDRYMTKPIVDFNEFKVEINEQLIHGRSNGAHD